ncbi:MAG: hypothetical protein ACT4P7_23700 [Gemmatimonadaceae bacterium]
MSRFRRFRPLVSLPLVVAFVVFAAKVVSGTEVRMGLSSPFAERPVAQAELVNVPAFTHRIPTTRLDLDSLVGRSGHLRARILEVDETEFYPELQSQYGATARRPGVRAMSRADTGFAFITMAPWTLKLGSHINGYHVGYWPGEERARSAPSANPVGFIEVTRDNADTQLSTHFRLRDFVTHDQKWVWPKYVVLREDLLDKLELVLAALQSFGVATHHVVVLSGFRSPQYNARGVGEGMARASRHQFGDAADVIIDANRDGRMDDLNLDGRVTFADLQVVDRAVQLIERKYPELIGGLGLYHEMGPSGPFAHIDVRGTRARWTNLRRTAKPTSTWRASASGAVARSSGRCQAEGAMAVLCAGMQ